MPCVYCGSSDLKDSDVVPFSVAKDRLINHNVCAQHRTKIKLDAEKEILPQLNYLRRQLNIPVGKRQKDVPYPVSLHIHDKEYPVDHYRGVSDAFLRGQLSVNQIGSKVKLRLSDAVESSAKSKSAKNKDKIYIEPSYDYRFLSSQRMLRIAAKIAFEWYCEQFDVSDYDTQNDEIIQYIMRDNTGAVARPDLVQIITDADFYSEIGQVADLGDYALTVNYEIGGQIYVIFVLWGIIAYKVMLGKAKWSQLVNTIPNGEFFCIRNDGSTKAIYSPELLDAMPPATDPSPEAALQQNMKRILDRVGRSARATLMTKQVLKKTVKKIRHVMELRVSTKIKTAYLLTFHEPEMILTAFVLIKLYESKDKAKAKPPFDEVIGQIALSEEIVQYSVDAMYAHIDKYKEENLVDAMKKGIGLFCELK